MRSRRRSPPDAEDFHERSNSSGRRHHCRRDRMSGSAFAILPASTTVPLDGAGHGSASFTVTNQTGRPVRVRVAITAVGELPPPMEWLTPPPSAERDLATDGAQQFTVLVDVPARSPGGAYQFRLDAISVELPDEEWAHSPQVHFVVPEPEPIPDEPTPEPPPEPKGYLETSAGALLGGFAGGLGAGLIGAIALVVAAGLPTPGTDFGEALGQVILLVVLVVIFVALSVWIGAALGVLLFLRSRGFAEPGRTVLLTALLLPIWAAVLLFLISRLPEIELPGPVSLIVLLLIGAVIILLPALAGRAIFRFRTTGGL
ncbi:hypothetical protein BH23CHL6_BH23CHL6_01070 [soil metagenome]